MMPIPRKNPRTVISEEQKKLTEDTTTRIPTQIETQSAISTNDTKDQRPKSANDTIDTNDKDPQSIQSAMSTNDTKDQRSKSANDAIGTNDKDSQSIQSAMNTNDTKDQSNENTTLIRSAPPQANAQSAMKTVSKKPRNMQTDKGKISTKSQHAMSTKDMDTQSTEDREREVYYLTPSQVDKLDDLRIAYRKATGNRLSKQDFMRHIVDSLDLHMLL